MQTGQYQRAVYDFSAAVKYDEQNATYYGRFNIKVPWPKIKTVTSFPKETKENVIYS